MVTSNAAPPRTLVEAFQANVQKYADRIALRTPGDAQTITWREYGARVRSIAAGLAGLDVRPGDTVALMVTNRPEFHLCDTAVLHTGATPFSMYNTNPPEMLAFLYGNADNRVVICEKQFLPGVLAAKEIGGKVEHVICVDGDADGAVSLASIEAAPDAGFDFDATWRSVEPDDVLTIIYTSGTTGQPKGVQITHANYLANAKALSLFGEFGVDDRVVSYLPDAHGANRWMAHNSNLHWGLQITTVADAKHIVDALKDARPSLFMGVPRIWVKVKAALESQIANDPSPVKRALANWAIGVGRDRARHQSARKPLPLALQVQHAVAERLVLSTVRTKLGLDNMRLGASSAAPLPPEVHEFILGLGLPVVEAWGMSELTAAGTINRVDDFRIGSVGQAVPGGELKLADDGELLVRGPFVMKGYRNDPEKTAEAVDSDGWMHTGDIATIDDDGFVTIVDRKKELIINSAGKNMAPTHIENTIVTACPLVGPVIAVGDGRQYVTALVTLDPDAVSAFAGKHGLNASSAELHADATVYAAVEAGIAAANTKLARVEQIKKFIIVPESWSPGGEFVTPTLKLKRKPILAKYADQIDRLYG